MKQGTIGRRVSIVFEETGGAGLNVYLDGNTKGIRLSDPGEDLSPADFYASRMLAIIVHKLKETGAFTGARKRD